MNAAAVSIVEKRLAVKKGGMKTSLRDRHLGTWERNCIAMAHIHEGNAGDAVWCSLFFLNIQQV
jgi:hypothetical protein